mgnify:CR=1 FL=1
MSSDVTNKGAKRPYEYHAQRSFEGIGGKNFAIPVFDYKNSFCLEIPFIVLFEKSLYNFDRIVVIKPS